MFVDFIKMLSKLLRYSPQLVTRSNRAFFSALKKASLEPTDMLVPLDPLSLTVTLVLTKNKQRKCLRLWE